LLSQAARTRLNVPFYLMDMILFGLAFGFMDTSTVIPEFVGQATDSKVLVGLSGVLFALAWRLPQILVASSVNRTKSKRRYMFFSSAPGRISVLVIAAFTAVAGGRNPGLMLLVFFVGYAFFAVCDGITSVAWVELIGSAVADRTRGVMFSISHVITGVAILGVQGIIRALLGPQGPGYPANYAVLFGIAGLLYILSLFFILNFHEPPVESKARVIEPAEYMPYLRRILRKDGPFRSFLVMRFFLDCAFFIVTPFYIGYEVERLGIPSAQAVGDSLIAVILGTIFGSLVAAWLSSRYGTRVVVWTMMLTVITGPVLALLSPAIGHAALLVSFATIGFAQAASSAGVMNWLIAYPMAGNRGVYMSIASILGVVSLLAPAFGGQLLQWTSYPVLFGTALVLAGLAALASLRLVEPKGQGNVPSD
jgi:MFS family permease